MSMLNRLNKVQKGDTISISKINNINEASNPKYNIKPSEYYMNVLVEEVRDEKNVYEYQKGYIGSLELFSDVTKESSIKEKLSRIFEVEGVKTFFYR